MAISGREIEETSPFFEKQHLFLNVEYQVFIFLKRLALPILP